VISAPFSNFRGNAKNVSLAKVTMKHEEIDNVAARALSYIRVPLIQHRFDQCISPVPDYLFLPPLTEREWQGGEKKRKKKFEGRVGKLGH
jgi:hypothetical protein